MADQVPEVPNQEVNNIHNNHVAPASDPKNMQEVTQYVSTYLHYFYIATN